MLRNFKDDYEFYQSLPKKRIGASVLLFYKGDLLVVQPTYSPGWILPGGTIEAEESPLEGLHREIHEELSLQIEPLSLLAVDYVHNRDVRGEYLNFLFSAKDLTEKQALDIQLQAYELKDYRFIPLDQAYELLVPLISRRVKNAITALEERCMALYLEDGNEQILTFPQPIPPENYGRGLEL